MVQLLSFKISGESRKRNAVVLVVRDGDLIDTGAVAAMAGVCFRDKAIAFAGRQIMYRGVERDHMEIERVCRDGECEIRKGIDQATLRAAHRVFVVVTEPHTAHRAGFADAVYCDIAKRGKPVCFEIGPELFNSFHSFVFTAQGRRSF